MKPHWLNPEAVGVLTANGNAIGNGGNQSRDWRSYSDKDYSDAGAKIAYDKKKFMNADILVKAPL